MKRDIQTLPLNLLKLDQENVRFGNDIAQNQREAIELMMSDPDDARKILRLAEHIAVNGLDPSELQLVTPDAEAGFIVLEGNRRLTALKLLQRPDLCPNDKLVKDFVTARSSIVGEFPEEVECSVVSSRQEGDKWLELKHTGQNSGVGRVNWDSDIRDERRARQTGIESIGRQIRNLVADHKALFSAEAVSGVSKIPVTTLTRLFSSTPAQETFQLRVEDKILKPNMDMELIVPSLEFAIDMFISSGYNVNDIRSDDDRKVFVARIPLEITPLHLQAAAKAAGKTSGKDRGTSPHAEPTPDEPSTPKSGDTAGQDSSGKDDTKGKTRAKPSARARKYLLPWSLAIDDGRINEIYRELRHILEVERCPNAVAVTFRVFLELTCDHYTKLHLATSDQVLRHDTRAPLKTGNADNLSIKIQAISQHLLNAGKLNKGQSKAVSRRASHQNTVGSADHFNLFVHDAGSRPIPSELKDIADEYRPFLEAIWV